MRFALPITFTLTLSSSVLGVTLIAKPGSPELARPPKAAGDSLSTEQIENLLLLGKVWGFAKYHHARVASGQVDWDSELRRIIPAVLQTRGPAATTTAISEWLARVGAPDPCSVCASTAGDAHLLPDADWIRDERQLGRHLSAQLLHIYQNRPIAPAQRYVSFAPNVGNPVFATEASYGDQALPPADLRLLSLYRFWNIIEYWFPYRDLIEEDWDGVLREFIPRLWVADSADAYRLTMMALVARVHDGHANLWNMLSVRPPRGVHRLPVTLRFIEEKAVVTGFSHAMLGPASRLRVGDVILGIDGARVDSLVAAWEPHYAASNQPTRLRDMARSLTQGPAGPVRVTGERDGKPFAVVAHRVPLASLDRMAGSTHDLPGETFQMLAPDVAYLKLSSVSVSEATEYVRRAAGAKVLVIDIRNYPREFMVFALGRHLVSARTEFARFTKADPSNPGAFRWAAPIALSPAPPHFNGSVVILVDESSQSSAEYTAMAFRAAPNALVVGSTTAGADGNVSPIPLPGGLRAMISGIGVFYPDRRPTQRLGILPDLVVRPTIASIRQGRDEVLEAGVSRALGREFKFGMLQR
jgi:C-terminal processing protease CtpA/Prc